MTDDIVARLRAWSENAKEQGVGVVVDGLEAAADEIERLRSVVEAWKTYSSRAERDIKTLRAERDGYLLGNRQTLAALAESNEISKKYKAERDEARREVCSMNETGLRMNESDKKREAKRRGWDCFKEDTDER